MSTEAAAGILPADELSFKLEELSYKITDHNTVHTDSVSKLQAQAKDLQKRLKVLKDRSSQLARDQIIDPTQSDVWARRVEWRVAEYSTKLQNMAKGDSVWSPEFTIMGFKGLQLEFFPAGRSSTRLDGFCSVFLWCPAGLRVKYQLRVGEYTAAPDEDEYASRIGHGHSNFCLLAAQVDKETDSVLVGLNILSLTAVKEGPDGLKFFTNAPEVFVADAGALLRNREHDTVEWTLKDIAKKRAEVPQGLALCSPLFSAAGVDQMLMEFYPNGMIGSSNKGNCGFYLRCPSGTSLIVTLFVGKAQKGPIRADFDGNSAKGLPEFCKLEEQLDESQNDLVVGIKLRNTFVEKEEKTTLLEI